VKIIVALQGMGQAHRLVAFGKYHLCGTDDIEDPAVIVGDRLGDDLFHLELAQKEGDQNAGIDLLPHAHDDTIQFGQSQSLQGLLVAGVSNDRPLDKSPHLVDFFLVDINSEDVMAAMTEFLGQIMAEAAESDDGIGFHEIRS